MGTRCLETPAPATPHLNQRHPETEEDPRRMPALEQTAAPQVEPLLPMGLVTPSALCTPTPDLTGEQHLPELTQQLWPSLPSPIMAGPCLLSCVSWHQTRDQTPPASVTYP